MPFENLPEEELTALKSLGITCHNPQLKTDPEFETLVRKLAAGFIRPKSTTPPVLGVFLGMTANLNSEGPLQLHSVEPTSSAHTVSRLRAGDIITQAGRSPVRNLEDLGVQVRAAHARGQRSINLSVARGNAYFGTTLEF